MSFRQIPIQNKKRIGKESDSLQLLCSQSQNKHLILKERASSFTSKAYITLEAAVVIPVFFFAVLCMVYLFEVMAIQSSVRSALQEVGKDLAQSTYTFPFLSEGEMEETLVNIIGEEKLENSIVVNGAEGFSCAYSSVNLLNTVMDLNVSYQIEIPVLMFRIPIRTYEERLRVKGWTGYASGSSNSAEDDMVYVTDYGLVYHKSLTCSYLELSIRGVSAVLIDGERNQSGGRYYLCERCEGIPAGVTVYVTDYGTRYHTSLNCSGLKRNIYIVPLSEVNGLGGCSKCVH